MNKSEVFKTQLSYITDNDIRKQTETVLRDYIPDYFFECAASSTGKYHPKLSLGKGGLVRHVKFAVEIAKELLQLDQYKILFDEKMRSYIYAALILHDAHKSGATDKEYCESTYTRFDHPVLISKTLVDLAQNKEISTDYAINVTDLILSHMGQWNTSTREPLINLPKPESHAQKFVHMCDYLSSKKLFDNVDIGDK